MNKYTEELIDFLDESPSCYHAVANIEKKLRGYVKLNEKDKWYLEPGGSYYVVRNDSSIIAFKIPGGKCKSLRIAASHSDSPTFKIKINPEISDENYIKINTEKYGGMIMYSWFDRPLSVAGRVIYSAGDSVKSKIISVDRDLLLIPSVAIHMNRDMNDNLKLDPQVDMLPLFGSGNAKNQFMNVIASEAGIEEERILSSDLFLYPRQSASIWGESNEFISAGALDDLQCVYATMKGFINSKNSADTLRVCCVFNNEEVGSLTRQGADSDFLYTTLKRINLALGYDEETLYRIAANGLLLSADNAHAVHPNHPEYADPTNKPYINKGIVIKRNSSEKYTTDGFSEGMLRKLCIENNIPIQSFLKRLNIAGGSTLGNLLMRHISIPAVDIGLPQLAMHSAYETAGVRDTEYLVKLSCAFFA